MTWLQNFEMLCIAMGSVKASARLGTGGGIELLAPIKRVVISINKEYKKRE